MQSGEASEVETLLEELERAGVVRSVDDDGMALTDEILEHLEEAEAFVDDADDETLRAELEEWIDDDDELTALVEIGEANEDILVEYLALCRFLEGELGHAERLRSLSWFGELRHGEPRDEGAPEAFLPVHTDRLPLLLRLVDHAMVYVWLDDCDPCDLMVETFDDVVDEPPEGLALFAAFGPDAPRLLHEQYDIYGGPAIASFVNGEVDARFYGAQTEKTVETELRKAAPK